jgi:putative transposase
MLSSGAAARAAEAGFPRFKGRDRFPGWGYKTHGDGFRFTPGADWHHGRLRLSGVGTIVARGQARTQGRIVAADVVRKSLGATVEWWLSLVIECRPVRRRVCDRAAGLDWGVETFATMAYGPGAYAAFANERLLDQEKDALRSGRSAAAASDRGGAPGGWPCWRNAAARFPTDARTSCTSAPPRLRRSMH